METVWEYAVLIIHSIKDLFAMVKNHELLGIPLDHPFRFLFLGFLYYYLSATRTRRRAFWICLVILVGKETFDIVAVRSLMKIKLPELGDYLDLLSGLAGIGVGDLLVRYKMLGEHPVPSDGE